VTLRTRLTAAFVLVVVVPLLVGVGLLVTTVPRAFAQRQERSVQEAATLVAAVVADWCDRARVAAEAAGRAALATDDPAAAQAALRSLVDRGLASGLRVTSGAGRIITAGEPPSVGRDCTVGEPSDAAVTAVVRLEQAGARPGEAVATVGAGAQAARQLSAAAGTGDVALLAGRDVVAQSGPIPADLVVQALDDPGRPVRGEGRVAALVRGRPGSPLGVLVVEPVVEGVQLLRTAIAVVLGAALLAGWLGLLLARATTRPLEELGDAAARVAGGDLATTIEVRSSDEVGRLAVAFNSMTDELRDYVGALEASRRELRAGLARLGETLLSTHDLDRILAVVLETALASTAAQAGAVLLVDADRQVLELAVGRGLEERGAGPALVLPIGTGVLGRVARDGVPLSGSVAELGASPAEPPASTVIAVPLRGAGPVVGVLALYDPRAESATVRPDLSTLMTLASQAGVAMDNVLVHRDAQRMAVTDALTGLGNYRSFTTAIGKETERATRFGRSLSLLLLDLDHFKEVNDTYGHQRGDRVLVELARRVREQVREVDMVARYGGEELVVVLPETDEPGAARAAERIRRAVRERAFGSDGQPPVQITVSLGVAVFPVHARTAAALLRRADEALYEAKRCGRDAWRMATAPPASHLGGAD